MIEHKYFNERKYILNRNRWVSTSYPQFKLSHDVWDYNNPDNQVKEGEVIHHKNKDSSDDRIENLEKMTHGEHNTLHHAGKKLSEETKQLMKDNHADMAGENSPNWKGGMKYKSICLDNGTIETNYYYTIYQIVNSLGEIKSTNIGLKEWKKKENER